jgi:hypothetical protein
VPYLGIIKITDLELSKISKKKYAKKSNYSSRFQKEKALIKDKAEQKEKIF